MGRLLTSSVDLLLAHRNRSPGGRDLLASSHPTVLASQVAWITGQCQISQPSWPPQLARPM